MHLLQVFSRFDPKQKNVVNPRDFCLSVSVLLDGDPVVLTKSDWADIVEYFQDTDMGSVNYIKFCEFILNPKEILNEKVR